MKNCRGDKESGRGLSLVVGLYLSGGTRRIQVGIVAEI